MNDYARVDTARLAELIAAEDLMRRTAPVAWRVRRFLGTLFGFVVIFLVVVPLVDGDMSRVLDATSSYFWVRAGAALAVALLLTAAQEIVQRRQWSDPGAAAERQARETLDLTSAGWHRRVLWMGVKLGLGVGIPVGALLALMPTEPLAAVDRVRTFGLFVVATMGWTIPTAFILRTVSLHLLKRRGLLG